MITKNVQVGFGVQVLIHLPVAARLNKSKKGGQKKEEKPRGGRRLK